MQVISTYNDSSLHLGADHNTLEDSTSNWDIASEGAFFVDVLRFDSFFRGSESETNVLEVADAWGALLSEQFLAV